MDESLACVSNENRPRHVTEAEKKAILAAYGLPADTDESTGEFDHWLPHWMGGSDGPKNIWFERHAGKFGSVAKDKVELLLYRKVWVDKNEPSECKEAVFERLDQACSKEMNDVGREPHRYPEHQAMMQAWAIPSAFVVTTVR